MNIFTAENQYVVETATERPEDLTEPRWESVGVYFDTRQEAVDYAAHVVTLDGVAMARVRKIDYFIMRED